MKLQNLVDAIEYIELVNFEDNLEEFTGIAYNSKKVQPNDLFICLSGEHVDGHEFAEEAVACGAIACVVERRLNIDVPQIVVNSTQEMIAKISSEFRRVHDPSLSSSSIVHQQTRLVH